MFMFYGLACMIYILRFRVFSFWGFGIFFFFLDLGFSVYVL